MHTIQPPHRTRSPALAVRHAAILSAFAIATLTAVISGCGSSSPSQSTAAAPPQNIVNDAFKYSACMRNHGVSGFPDPKVSSSNGDTRIALMAPSSTVSSPSFTAAQKACKGIMPAPQNNSAAQLAQQHARELDVLAFTRCLRGHGISDFPDPTVQGQLTLAMVTSAGVDLHSPQLLAAAKACVGVTHGAITPADVQRAVNSPQ
jgi:hypothetical protein